MTEEEVPTPSPELLERWASEWCAGTGSPSRSLVDKAAAWGYRQGLAEADRGYRQGFAEGEAKAQALADAELEACCEWLHQRGWYGTSDDLRAARRPKPPSLKQQALSELEDARNYAASLGVTIDIGMAVKALKSIPEDES